MKISFITTIFNEEKTIETLLLSIKAQTKKPYEVVIVDGGSTDATLSIISHFKSQISNIKIIKKKGNRSIGRNEAIRNTKGDIIVCSDAGCRLDKKWVENITTFFQSKDVNVVSGYYKPITHSIFEKCLASYTCVMPDKINPKEFLPSSRSIAFQKIAWEKVGGYPEHLDTCEDLVFAKKLKESNFKFMFAKNAIVYWPQRSNIIGAITQFFKYSTGDGEALYFRRQTPLLFLKLIIGLVFLYFFFKTRSITLLSIFCVGLMIYILWAISKNYKYVKNPKAFIYLPILQITSDFSVILGMLTGFAKIIVR